MGKENSHPREEPRRSVGEEGRIHCILRRPKGYKVVFDWTYKQLFIRKKVVANQTP